MHRGSNAVPQRMGWAGDLPVVAALACALLAGCRVEKHTNGSHEDVNIQTPFGGMKVDTAQNGDTSAIGLSAYPGARPADDSKDGNDAKVDMSFGGFHLGVKAASFQTPDSPEKVLAFYRKDMRRYGDVIECKGDEAVGQPMRTGQGLTCRDDQHVIVDTGGTRHGGKRSVVSGEMQLKAGSERHQHIVAVETKNGGTKIELVMVDLPGEHNDKRPE